MHTRTYGMNSPVLSESEALRALDLPSSRREWLRNRVEHGTAGKCLIYRRQDIDALRLRLTADHRDAEVELRAR